MYAKKLLKITVVLFAMVGAGSLGIFWGIYENWQVSQKKPAGQGNVDEQLLKTKQPPQEWMTIFVHGTFGTAMGLLSLPQIVKDSLQESLYKKMANRMRKDPFFYKDQPILRRGLIKVTPTFDLSITNHQPIAAFPLFKVYEMVAEFCHQNEINHFYTYGWSGLMSQHRRRLEALRFYNAIGQELEKFHIQGLSPKIRILTHSHGGNLCLNLAAVEKVINLPSFLTSSTYQQATDEEESLAHVFDLLKKMPNQELALKNKGLKQLDYVPTHKNLTIDELILFGTPIQPETATFCLSNTFKKIYNFYSDNDTIQQVDFLSTKGYGSGQKFACVPSQKTHIIQARIMLERNWNQSITKNKSSIKNVADPSHKDFWFFSWNDDWKKTEALTGIKPFPIAAFTPLFLSLCNQLAPDQNDIDVNIKTTTQAISIMAAQHNQTQTCKHQDIPLSFLDTLKQKITPWKPVKKSGFDELHEMYNLLVGLRTSSN